MDPLFTPIRLAGLDLRNRIVMAPMTRLRATGGVANDVMAKYYAQRATAGLIVTECTMVSPTSAAYIAAPGIYNADMCRAWGVVTAAVHAKGGKIFNQLWHSGRVSHRSLQPDNAVPIAPSAIAGEGDLHTYEGKQPFSTPRALSADEIKGVVQDFTQAAIYAADAGFDGVELHGAYGYLIDQFLQSGSNQRTDDYGGSAANRSRFLFNIIESIKASVNIRIGVKLSPSNRIHGMSDANPAETFGYVFERLNAYDLAYVHVMRPNADDRKLGVTIDDTVAFARRLYKGTIIGNGGYDRQSASDALARKQADLVSFGVPFLANPDLPRRLQDGIHLAAPDFATVYGVPGAALEKGYTDYPVAE